MPGEEAPVLRSHQHPRDLAPTHLQHRACGTQKGTIMVNDTVKYAGLHMTEETFKVSDKPILLTSLLFDRSSSEDQPVAGPGSPLRIDLLNQFIKLFVETLAKDDDVNERVLIDMIAFNHEVEIVGGSDFAHPRDIAIPVLTAAGGTDYDLALNTAIDRSRARARCDALRGRVGRTSPELGASGRFRYGRGARVR